MPRERTYDHSESKPNQICGSDPFDDQERLRGNRVNGYQTSSRETEVYGVCCEDTDGSEYSGGLAARHPERDDEESGRSWAEAEEGLGHAEEGPSFERHVALRGCPLVSKGACSI